MIGAHSPNVDVDEFRIRCGSALRLDAIFQQYPHWERKPARLKLKRNRDADHLSPRQWRGELRAVTCDLDACWKGGVLQAEEILTEYGYIINFGELFKDWTVRGIDLMRPKGGKYPGVSAEIDRSLGESAESQDIGSEMDYSFQSFDGVAALAAEEEHAGVAEAHSIWMELDGKKVHKKTILRTFMDPAMDVDYNKSHDRLLRVRYFSIGGDNWDRSTPNIYSTSAGSNIFSLNSLYATLICVENKVSLAVLQCTLLKASSKYIDCAPIDEISLPESTYSISGQVLSLHPVLESLGDTAISWAWDSQFVALDTFKSRRATTQRQPTTLVTSNRLRNLNVTISGCLVYPLTSVHAKSVAVNKLPALPAMTSDLALGSTWVITEKTLSEIQAKLVQFVLGDEGARSEIPLFGQVREGAFPYTATLNNGKSIESFPFSVLTSLSSQIRSKQLYILPPKLPLHQSQTPHLLVLYAINKYRGLTARTTWAIIFFES